MRSGVLAAALLLAPAAPLAAQRSSADYTELYQQQALKVLRTSIGYRTAAGLAQVPALAAWLAEQFRAGGFPAEDVHVLPLTTDDGEQTASLVVRYRGDGSPGARPILLLAHMVVVDALPEDWERDPFTLLEEGGYFFGRGTSDDKSGVAILTNLTLRQRYNLEGTTSYGVDLLGSWQWTPRLALEFAGSWLEAYSDTPNGLPDRQLPQRPDYELGTALTWRNDQGALARIALRHTGPAVDVAPRVGWVELPSGTELNLRAEWPLHAFGIGTLWVTAAADNLTDAVVYTQAGLPLAGRTLRLGFRLE